MILWPAGVKYQQGSFSNLTHKLTSPSVAGKSFSEILSVKSCKNYVKASIFFVFVSFLSK